MNDFRFDTWKARDEDTRSNSIMLGKQGASTQNVQRRFLPMKVEDMDLYTN